ncbi:MULTISPECIES: ATP-binding protein [Vibrio]|uniref:ATP-binding protein n=1 Tax=Vibrio TaxID=662 RepID=UPI00207589D4|nr:MULTISPECIES: DUF3404 domain-containing protein [Vibrio]USD35011.1 DUF3404 domain-containing protein [Vibrio sp. SCSIO 43186]USD48077.1 DUF3404 domain-containing protein [Vibrio sp. SCSIO 43145]USD72136.1 DUF3404 domain-containing protein [Vibrio sp. SCSIO 43139]USD97807.1 histidine kinase [Vibrio coralliilyticus]
MRRYRLVMCFIMVFPCYTQAQSLQERWQSLYQKSWQSEDVLVSQQQLSRFPAELLQERTRYPDFEYYTWSDIKYIHEISRNCSLNDPLPQHLSDAAEFELALCKRQKLNEEWFATHHLLHPAGGSFADRYLAQYPDIQSDNLFRYLTVNNPRHPLHSQFSALSATGREALLKGYRAWMEDDTLWLSGEQGWKSISADTWRPLARQLDITITGPNCTFRYSNLCISEMAENVLALRWFVAGLSLLILFTTAKGLYAKRKQSRERRFVLQLLTHELRTPMTSLGLTVEMLRDQFDHLPEKAQEAVWRLMSDHQRLSQLTENSKIYLSTQRSEQLLEQTAYLSDWLDHICKKHQLDYQLNQNKALTLPFYWLSICLENLIKNAKQHGKGEIGINVTLDRTLVIEVTDQGSFPSPMKRFLTHLRRPTNNENMGIGLNIVEHLIQLIGGKLTIQRQPTRCTLEIPL